MGSKESKSVPLRIVSRAETLKPIWNLPVDYSSTSMEEEPSRDSEKQALAALHGRSTSDVQPTVMSIDVKTVKTHFSTRTCLHVPIYNAKPVRRRVSLRGNFTQSQSELKMRSVRTGRFEAKPASATFEDEDFANSQNVFVINRSPLGKNLHRNERAKTVRSNYKLIKPGRQSNDQMEELGSVGNAVPVSLLKFVQENLEEGQQFGVRKVQIKHLHSSSCSTTPQTSSYNTFAMLSGTPMRKETTLGKGTYSIKTPRVFALSEKNFKQNVESRSRAERTWRWKGKMGAIKDETPAQAEYRNI